MRFMGCLERKGMVLALLMAAGFALAPGMSVAATGLLDSGLFQLGTASGEGADILGGPSSAQEAGPDWADLFNADCARRDDSPQNGVPDFVDLYGGVWAVFLKDDISLTSSMESSAVALQGEGVINARAAADHDIGNAYAYATRDTVGDLVLFGGFERLGSGESSLEFEFSQNHRRLGHGGFGTGAPWEIVGDRRAGDLLVLLSFSAGGVVTVEILRWDGAAFRAVETLSGLGCNAAGTVCAAGNLLDIEGGPWPNSQPAVDPETIAAGRFYEFGLNVSVLLGATPAFDTICVRSPQDIAFGYTQEGD